VPAAPVTLIDTNAARVLVLVPGTYLTVIVQVLLVANVVPLVQVPPLMENVPPPLVVLVMVGAAVNCVEAPVVFVTVMVAFLVVVFPGVVVIAGLGAENDTAVPVPPRLAMFSTLEPPGFDSVTVRNPVFAPDEVGLKCTATVQLACGANDVVQVPVVPNANWFEVTPKPENGMLSVVLGFVTVTD
jgi:hypothetical protein